MAAHPRSVPAQPPASEPAEEARPRKRGSPGRGTHQRVLAPGDQRYPCITRVCRHLGCEVVEVRGRGEPPCIYLGANLSMLREARGMRASPGFRTLDSLEFFCRMHLSSFLALDGLPHAPHAWFWHHM
jgi:hypothetical protein